MSDKKHQLLEEMLRIFPKSVIEYPAAPHKCLECDEISVGLKGKTWVDVPSEFLANNCDVLPLLSEQAYIAYLPAFVREGLLNPDGGVAAMVPINLARATSAQKYSAEQRRVLVDAVKEMGALSVWGANDPSHLENIRAVELAWSPEPT